MRKPNIIFIIADDAGYGDVGCYNPESKIPTPHIDRLATEGVRFTDAHAPGAVCTPTRYGVLTGRYCWRTWLQKNVVGGYTPPLIEPDRTTVASMLKENGYRTACVGKWHLGLGWTRRNGLVGTHENAEELFPGSRNDGDPAEGMDVDFTKPTTGGPTELGFDYAYFTSSCSTMEGPFAYIENDRVTAIPDKPIFVDKTSEAEYFRPREGWIAPGYVLETVDMVFAEKAVEFIERSTTESPERPFFLYLPTSAPHTPWLAPTFMQGRSEAGPRGDMVALYDWVIGEVSAALDRLGIADDTLIIVTSDHGPHAGENGHKSVCDFRGHKSHIWEGGHRVPFVARWPRRIEAGTVSDEPICLTDMMATWSELTGADMIPQAGPDSTSILPALVGEAYEGPLHDGIVSHSCYGVFAIRRGPWKLICNTLGSGGWVEPEGTPPDPDSPGQLYNLDDDPGEQNNLFDARGDIVSELTELLETYKREGRSVPAPSRA